MIAAIDLRWRGEKGIGPDGRSYISGFSPESSWIDDVAEHPYRQVFWLVLRSGLPVQEHSGQRIGTGMTDDKTIRHRTYSYGDSAGLAPDFPF